jgi:hypothetical protein
MDLLGLVLDHLGLLSFTIVCAALLFYLGFSMLNPERF